MPEPIPGPRRPHGRREITDLEMALQAQNTANLDLLIEEIESLARHPENVGGEHRQTLIHVAAQLIAALTQ